MIKLSDFGLAAPLEDFGGAWCSRWLYMGPEVYEERTCLKSDVWALGISIIEIAEGKHPFAGMTSANITKQLIYMPSPSLSSSGWSSDLVDFVNACLVKDVNERSSVEELLKVSVSRDCND